MSGTDTKDMKPADVASRIKELRAQLAARQEKMDAVVAAAKIEDGGGIVVTAEQRDDFRANLTEAKEIKSLLDDLEGYAEVKQYLDTPAGQSFAVLDAVRAATGGRQAKTLGQMLIESDQFREMVSRGLKSMTSAFVLDEANIGALWSGERGVKDIYTASAGDTGGPALGTRERPDIVERPRRGMRVRDLFPNDTTTSSLIEFLQVTGFLNTAAPVSERSVENGVPVFTLKPKSNLLLTSKRAPVETIAHWIRVHRNVLTDEPRLRRIIDGEMLYGLRLAEDAQILAGSGTSPELLGILNTPGVQFYDQATTAGDRKSNAVRRAATRAFLAHYEPTGAVFHPFDWEDIELEETTDGQFRVALAVAIGAERRIWRLDAVETPAIPEGTGLVGAFGLGARLWDRQEARVLLSTEDQDNVVRNAVTILAEQRLALEVARPESFVVVTFTP